MQKCCCCCCCCFCFCCWGWVGVLTKWLMGFEMGQILYKTSKTNLNPFNIAMFKVPFQWVSGVVDQIGIRERAHITKSIFAQFWTPLWNQDNHGPDTPNLLLKWLYNMWAETATFDNATKNYKKIIDLSPYKRTWKALTREHGWVMIRW